MIGGKGIRRFHPPGLAQFQPHAKDCATLALIPNFEPIGCRSLAARSAPCSQRSLGTSLSLIGDKRYYGESPVGLRRYERAVGDAVPPIPSKTAKVAPGKLA